MRLTVQQQKSRADVAENIAQFSSMYPGLKQEHSGSKGHSVFAKKLDYILPANFFLVPFAHALLYGVLKDFWGALLPPKTGEQCTHAAFFLSVAVIAIQLSCQVVFLSGCLHATQINAHAWW